MYIKMLTSKLLKRREFPQFDRVNMKSLQLKITGNDALMNVSLLRLGKRQRCLPPPLPWAVLFCCKICVPKKDCAVKNHRTDGENVLGARNPNFFSNMKKIGT